MPRRSLCSIMGIALMFGAVSIARPASTYSIDFHAITSGGNTLRGECYVITGSVGQVAPGYSSGGIYALYAGYQFPIPPNSNTGDEIFFNGFEGCGQ
jgi:hypothetical protein